MFHLFIYLFIVNSVELGCQWSPFSAILIGLSYVPCRKHFSQHKGKQIMKELLV